MLFSPALADSTRKPPCSGPDEDEGNGGGGDQLGVATKTRTRPKKPSQFKVLMLNDDYTPMEFVVLVLKRFFHMDLEQATRVMLHVHQKGVGVCGIFPYDIADTKVNQVMDFARQNQHPLQCTLEKA
jgi:ATP-dependent Clp protease adaptor protein ClpS